ncbi:MAG TPA: hypothetical protein VF138_01900 [Caulobacteraceae bacterium]
MKPGKRPQLNLSAGDEPGAAADIASVFGKAPKAERDPAAWPLYLLAFVITALWIGAPIAYVVRFQPQVTLASYDPFLLAAIALMALAPLALLWIAVYTLTQGMKLAAEARRARALADQMLRPAALASAEAGTVVEAVRLQIEEASASANRARDVMGMLRETLERETERLDMASANTVRTVSQTTETLGAERQRLDGLSTALEGHSAAIREGVNRAAEVTASAGQATEAARTAGEDLARHTARLETAGTGIGEQMRAVEQELAKQRASLLELADRLRGEQEGFAADADGRVGKLTELVAESRLATAEVSQSAQQGAEAIQHLIAAAAQQFAELAEAARREREAISEGAQQAIAQVTAAADEARKAADAQADSAQSRIEQMSEAAFEAGRKADAVFEARLTQAKGLVEESATLVDEAGEKARQRLEGWIAAARAAIGDVEKLLADITSRAEQLPADAARRADALRAAMEQNLGALVASAHKASEETKALDAAFQQRVRANYEMLSEAVRLMGLVAGEPAAPGKAVAAQAQAGKEPRLRLRPLATEDEFKGAMQAATAKAPASPPPAEEEEDGLGWKGLLQSLDRDGADPEHLSERMVAELTALGNPETLLPAAKIDGIAAAVQAGDVAGAREVVRQAAPQVVDKMSRRLFADAAVRGQAERYRRRFSAMLRDAAERDHEGFLVGSLLASNEGRAWLILDAAATNRP